VLFVGVRGCCSLVEVGICGICVVCVGSGHFSTRPEKIKKCRFHCQQAVEKYLKAFLVKHQIEFPKTHSIMTLINLCSKVDSSFKEKLLEADILTDYAVEIRYPDEWYEPTPDETKRAYELANEVKQFVLEKLMIHNNKK
jgi:HEPN domain-containing protein